MTEVFQSNSRRVNIKDVDEEIKRSTFLFIWSEILSVGLILLVALVVVFAKMRHVSLSKDNLVLYAIIGSLSLLHLIVSRMSFRKGILRIVDENRSIIYTSKELAITENYIFIDGVRPIRRR